MPGGAGAFSNIGGSGPGFISITFSMPGQRDMTVPFATWGASVDDMSAAFTQVGQTVLLRDFALQFSAEGGYFGSVIGPKWQELAPSTQADRARHGFPPDHPILIRTGELFASVTQRGAPGNVFTVGPRSVTVGSSLPKAGWHQWGTRKMPARVIVGLSFQSRSEIINILGSWVRDQARAAGLATNGAGWGANFP